MASFFIKQFMRKLHVVRFENTTEKLFPSTSRGLTSITPGWQFLVLCLSCCSLRLRLQCVAAVLGTLTFIAEKVVSHYDDKYDQYFYLPYSTFIIGWATLFLVSLSPSSWGKAKSLMYFPIKPLDALCSFAVHTIVLLLSTHFFSHCLPTFSPTSLHTFCLITFLSLLYSTLPLKLSSVCRNSGFVERTILH